MSFTLKEIWIVKVIHKNSARTVTATFKRNQGRGCPAELTTSLPSNPLAAAGADLNTKQPHHDGPGPQEPLPSLLLLILIGPFCHVLF
jgi:hypothetical protein